MTALVLIGSWWGYFVSTDDGVTDYLVVVILATLIWSVIALVTSAILNQNERDQMTNEIAKFLVNDSGLTITKEPAKRFRAQKAGDPTYEAFGDTPEEAIKKFVNGDIRKVKKDD